MFKVDAPVGNVFVDERFENIKGGNFEKLLVSRTELEKRILRKETDRGTDIGLNLNPGIKLRNGDVLRDGEKPIVIEQLPEKVISVRLKTKNVNVMVLLGHIIGNRHRPISIQKEEITFPIQADSEKEVFAKLFHNIKNHIEITIQDRIFSPHEGADVHEH